MKIESLSCHPEAVSVIAGWYYQEWGHVSAEITLQDIEEDLKTYTEVRDALPRALVAVQRDAIIGVAELKIREVRHLPQYEHWLGGLFVDPAHRGMSIGGELIQRVHQLAYCDYGIETLYLQTERLDGGLYTRHGWAKLQTIMLDRCERLIMSKALSQHH
ncbi:MAG: GNAT family N-acetyltransferase [Granulosicoccus sp.]|nr:GNAT family N-acetyltransferase [Granulosicoccus sp.]